MWYTKKKECNKKDVLLQVTPFLYEQMIVSERLLFIELEFLMQDFGKKGDV